jgi:toxin ParE1/3/4
MKVRYTPRARDDLDAIYEYLELRSPSGARAVKTRIERRIARLADFPFAAPLTEVPSVHEMSLLRHPYKVYYRVDGEEIWMLHIRHTARQNWQNER